MALDFLARKLPAVPPGAASVVDARDVAEVMAVAGERAPHGARYLVAERSMTLAEVFAELERSSGVPRGGRPNTCEPRCSPDMG